MCSSHSNCQDCSPDYHSTRASLVWHRVPSRGASWPDMDHGLISPTSRTLLDPGRARHDVDQGSWELFSLLHTVADCRWGNSGGPCSAHEAIPATANDKIRYPSMPSIAVYFWNIGRLNRCTIVEETVRKRLEFYSLFFPTVSPLETLFSLFDERTMAPFLCHAQKEREKLKKLTDNPQSAPFFRLTFPSPCIGCPPLPPCRSFSLNRSC